MSLTAAAKRTSTPPFRPPASPSHLFYLSLPLPLNLPRLFRSVARMKEAYLSDKVSPPSFPPSFLRSNYGIDLAVAPSLPLLCPAAGRRGVRGVVHATGTKNREREERHNEKSRCTAPPANASRQDDVSLDVPILLFSRYSHLTSCRTFCLKTAVMCHVYKIQIHL